MEKAQVIQILVLTLMKVAKFSYISLKYITLEICLLFHQCYSDISLICL